MAFSSCCSCKFASLICLASQAYNQNISRFLYQRKPKLFLFTTFLLKPFHELWSITYRDTKNRVYSVLIYFLAKTFSELPQNIIFPSITISIVFWLANIHPSYTVFFQILLILVFASNAAVGYGKKKTKKISSIKF